jgi:hypothetical protein
LPTLETDEQKLAFLLYVRREIPQLFSDAATFDIDLMGILGDQKELQDLLLKYPRYESQIAAWKNEIRDSARNALRPDKTYTRNELEAAIQDAIAKLRAHKAPPNPAASLMGGLMASLDPPTRARLSSMLKGKAGDEFYKILREELPETLPSSFRYSTQGFSSMPTRDEFVGELLKKEDQFRRAADEAAKIAEANAHDAAGLLQALWI